MSLQEFVETFTERGVDIERYCSSFGSELKDELQLFNGRALAKICEENKEGTLFEIFLYQRKAQKPTSLNILRNLKRSECRQIWYRENPKVGMDRDMAVISHLQSMEEGFIAKISLGPDYAVIEDYDTLEELVDSVVEKFEL